MYSFDNDYSEGAHQLVLDNIYRTNFIQTPGYGLDVFCENAANIIKNKIGHDDVDIHFIQGGTPCNVLAISTLKSYEAVICVETGHINVHETGAIEATGHKILTVKGINGKITAREIENVVLNHPDEHMVKPRMVFISNSTELGTIYHKNELIEISSVCRKYGLFLYMDGARLGSALMAKDNDLSLKDICELTDMFYIGGTKNGALIGEAMVIRNNYLKPNFRYLIKQHCSMLAKARLIGVEFITLLEKDLYFQIAGNANLMAQQLKQFFINRKVQLYVDSSTNQIFPILPNNLINALRQNYSFQDWKKLDNNFTAVRFVCSWATKQEDINKFIQDFNKLITKQ